MDRKQYPPKEVCRRLSLSYRQLEYWVLIGVVRPKIEPHGKKNYQKFSSEDLLFLEEVKALTDEGYLVSRAAEKVRKNGQWGNANHSPIVDRSLIGQKS